MKQLLKEDIEIRKALPVDLFSADGCQNKEKFAEMIDRVAEAMKGENMQQTLWKWQSRFLFRRQAPQEILNANEPEYEQEGSDAEMQGEGDMEKLRQY